LAAAGLTRVLIEGGGQLAAAALSADLVDALVLFRGPVVIGGDGLPAVAAMAIDDLANAKGFMRVDSRVLGDDVMESYSQQNR
jgi:diaminohydroxyphosphoribosylaminopyrimidine deaminase/5-amino-6-(5-phosphoribosylamino)uracil reductase